MNLPFLSRASDDFSPFVTVDIGTDSVKCCVFEPAKVDGRIALNIVGMAKETLPLGVVQGGSIADMDAVSETLSKALVLATNEPDYDVTEAIFGVSGDLSFGSMTTVRLTRTESAPFTKREIKKVNDKIYEASYNQALTDLLEKTGNSDLDIELLTSSVVYTKVDGKKVSDPLGIDGAVMEIALFTSYTPTEHVDCLQELAKTVGLRLIAVGSEMYSLVKLLTLKGDCIDDFVVMDIGGDITDVGVVFSRGIVSTRSLLLGGMSFTSYMGRKMNLPYADAEKKKLEYSFEKLKGEASGLRGLVKSCSIRNICFNLINRPSIFFTRHFSNLVCNTRIFGCVAYHIPINCHRKRWRRLTIYKQPHIAISNWQIYQIICSKSWRKLFLQILRVISTTSERNHCSYVSKYSVLNFILKLSNKLVCHS